MTIDGEASVEADVEARRDVGAWDDAVELTVRAPFPNPVRIDMAFSLDSPAAVRHRWMSLLGPGRRFVALADCETPASQVVRRGGEDQDRRLREGLSGDEAVVRTKKHGRSPRRTLPAGRPDPDRHQPPAV